MDLPQIQGKYRKDADLGKMCWFQVGGKVSTLFRPKDTEDLSYFLRNKPEGMQHFVFGVGSNLLIRDNGFDGVAIRLGREFNFVERDGDNIVVGAATMDLNVALFTQQEAITGLEFLAGIPGTIGGALAMNAGAYGTEIKDVLIEATAVNSEGEIRTFSPEEIGYRYRGKNLDETWIFTKALLRGKPGNHAEVQSRIEQIQSERGDSQPIKARTGGSTFKNPEGHKAWQLIDAAGCRGLKIGGAQVSEKHCNFFINTGDATAADIEQLITEVRQRVHANSGIELEAEIKIVGSK